VTLRPARRKKAGVHQASRELVGDQPIPIVLTGPTAACSNAHGGLQMWRPKIDPWPAFGPSVTRLLCTMVVRYDNAFEYGEQFLAAGRIR
jgi:hypothetical protein